MQQHTNGLKILFILGFSNPFAGAAWTRTGFFADYWSRKGHAVEVLGIFSYKAFRERGVKKLGNINIFNIIFNIGLMNPLVFILNTLISLAVSTLVLLSRKPIVTIVSVPTGDVGVGALMACRLTLTKYVVDYRDEWEDYTISLANSRFAKAFYSVAKKFAASIYAKGSFVAAVTPNFQKSLMSRGVVNVKLVPNGADVKTFKPIAYGEKDSFFRLIHSGSVGYRLDVAVKALKRLKENGVRNIKLIILGRGEVHELMSLARELGVYDLIEYKGIINDKLELAKLIAKSSVGLVLYDDNSLWKNTLPAKFFEYCACGIPVIATAYNDALLTKLIREYEIGLVAPPMDEEKLEEAIYQIYKNKYFREAAGKRARRLIEEKFDRNNIAEEYLDLIEKML
jgi:glycosyltransferase involved in cell wall biosynthesis